jgi:nucleoside phosphorylase
MLVILIPSAFEAKDLLARVTGRRNFRASTTTGARPVHAACYRGRFAGHEVMVGIIGMGPPHAARRAEAVLHEAKKRAGAGKIRGVILAGFAGALKPGVRRGEIFVTAGAAHVMSHLPENERAPEAPLHTAAALVATAAAKAALHASTGAALVDMEQAEVEKVAAAAGLPFFGLRIVSDEAHEELPHELLSRAYNQAAGVQTPLRLAGHLTRNPFKAMQLASFVRPLPPLRTRLTERLHTWLTLTGSRCFR